jgi:hypothetical protein
VERLYDSFKIGCVLKESDGGETGSSRGQTGRGVFEGDTSNGQHWGVDGMANLGEVLEPLGWPIYSL